MIPEFDMDFKYTDFDRGYIADPEEYASRSFILEHEPEPEEEL
jgi:hypothetical protein